jgi:hypothetical protein
LPSEKNTQSYNNFYEDEFMSSFTHNKTPGGNIRRLPLQMRRRELIQLVREHPDWRQEQLAAALKCDKSTISRDLREINEEFKVVNSDMWILSRERILSEIRDNKAECMRRLHLCSKPHQGARWMEEWSKLLLQESKILGINSPSHVMIQQETTITKEEKDAAINATLAQYEEPVIEIGPNGHIMLPLLEPEAEND